MRRSALGGLLFALLVGWTLALVPSGASSMVKASPALPAVDPEYIYTEWASLVTTYQHRESGYGQPGHEGFANAWAQEMQRNLQAFHPIVVKDNFPIQGWAKRPATQPAYNVEVSVPGTTDPGHVVVIGCHYDGEASSTESANDDGSGCAIELGVARAMAQYWTANHLAPARTLRFVAYDAEEQGIFGSFHYVNDTVNGDLANVVAMINEEQNGIGYPLRYLGKADNPTLPTQILWTPLSDNQSYPHQSSTLTADQRTNITNFDTLTTQAVPAVFAEFRALGYTSLDYQGTNGPVATQIFTPADAQQDIQALEDNVAGSDNYAFGLVGIPSATVIGNYSYYDRNPPPWSYPYDQPQDTVALMNVFASGKPEESPALRLSLALPGMLTAWLLAQPTVLGTATPDMLPVAALADIGPTTPGKSVPLDASGSYDPGGAALSYTWNFGDGQTASGANVQHTYATAGTFVLKLTVHGSGGTRTLTKALDVTTTPTQATNPYTQYQADGNPQSNPAVTLPSASGNTSGGASSSVAGNTGSALSAALIVLLAAVVIVLLIVVGVIWLARRQRQAK